jgi:hypothetical protein
MVSGNEKLPALPLPLVRRFVLVAFRLRSPAQEVTELKMMMIVEESERERRLPKNTTDLVERKH